VLPRWSVSSQYTTPAWFMAVTVYPHRLRHTCATQLLNAGCRVTSIQKFLGHKRLNSTMIYARLSVGRCFLILRHSLPGTRL